MKEKINLRVSFYTRGNRESDQESPIILRVSLNGERGNFGQIGLKVKPSLLQKSRISKIHSNANKLNSELEQIEARIGFLAEHLNAKGKLSLQNLRDEINGKKQSHQYISVLFDILISESEQRLHSGNLVVGTFRRHKNYARVFLNFIAYKYQRNDLRVDEVTKSLIADYEEYLFRVLGYSHNTLIKYMRFLNQATSKAIDLDTLSKDPFIGISYKEEETDRGFLDEKELATIMKTPIKEKHLDFIRDTFVFSCFTGLAYSDVAELKTNNIIHINDESWLLVRRKKTRVLSQIPLLPQALEILEKYKSFVSSDNRLLPLPCNQVINRQLKEVQQKCNLSKNLTFHLARHTFATLALSKGVSLETVNKILGHKKLSTTQIYAKVLTPKIAYEMNEFSNRLQCEKLVV